MPGVDVEQANAARMYDYYLGGSHNFAVDREVGDRALAAYGGSLAWARGNRRFLMRVVRHLVHAGVRQFLDLGSGIPTANHVHTTARAIAPETRVAYVDVDPVAVAHSEALLAGVDGVSVTRADLRDLAAVLAAPTVSAVLDLRRPVAVLAVAAIHFVPDADDPAGVLARYTGALPSGSHLAIAHGSDDYDDPDIARRLSDAAIVYRESATPVTLRSRAGIEALFGGLALLEPGLVDMNRWHPDGPDDPELGSYAAVARVP